MGWDWREMNFAGHRRSRYAHAGLKSENRRPVFFGEGVAGGRVKKLRGARALGKGTISLNCDAQGPGKGADLARHRLIHDGRFPEKTDFFRKTNGTILRELGQGLATKRHAISRSQPPS